MANFVLLVLALAAVLMFAVFSAKAAWGMYVKFTVASRGNNAAQKELKDLENQYAKMSAAVENLSTARGEEGEIRERFGVAKPGEGTIEIIRSDASTSGTGEEKENTFMRILHSLFVW